MYNIYAHLQKHSKKNKAGLNAVDYAKMKGFEQLSKQFKDKLQHRETVVSWQQKETAMKNLFGGKSQLCDVEVQEHCNSAKTYKSILFGLVYKSGVLIIN